MILTLDQEEELINVARLARDGRAVASDAFDSLHTDFYQCILDRMLAIIKIPNQEGLQ